MRLSLIGFALLLASCQDAEGGLDAETIELRQGSPRVLCVVAHPDDEIAFAGTLYKTATHLGGSCDLLVLTNGEGGYKYSTLGEIVYDASLTDPIIGRTKLPEIRRRELIAAGEVLHLRRIIFVGQKDHRFTLDVGEVLGEDAEVWDLDAVRGQIAEVLRDGVYDFVLTHLPVPETHGHHKAATILALEAVAAMRPIERPVVLGAAPSGRADEVPEIPDPVPGFPITALRSDVGPWTFDRTQRFGFKERLDYQIVVNWAIAEHKSQGTFQKLMNRWSEENFFLYGLDVPDADRRVERWFEELRGRQFTARDYGASDGMRKESAPAAARVVGVDRVRVGDETWYREVLGYSSDPEAVQLVFGEVPAMSLRVEGLDAILEAVRSRGGEVEVFDEAAEPRRAVVRDPAGKRIELIEQPPR